MSVLSTSNIQVHRTNPRPYHHHHHHLHHHSFLVRTVNGWSQLVSLVSHGRLALSLSMPKAIPETQQQNQNQEEDEEDFDLLAKIKSPYNDIMIVDSPTSRMLLLDTSFCVHSVLYKNKKWTYSYWDEFSSLPPIIPKGPIAILGLGGGTAAHLMLDLWPELQLEGWEIDQILIDKAREYFGLSDLEKPTKSGGVLKIHVGDALSPSVSVSGGYAGIVVDLFSNADVLPQLKEVETWLEIKKLLMPNGRIMVNCGGTVGISEADLTSSLSNVSSIQNSTIIALSKAFPGQLSWKRKTREFGANFMALTGQMPNLETWATMVPSPLTDHVKDWLPFTKF